MNVRSTLAAALAAALPTWLVRGYAYEPDAVTRPTVFLWLARLEPRPELDPDLMEATLELWVLVPGEDPSKVDDALDDALDDVLDALHPLNWISWDVAERGVLSENFNGYRITARAVAKIGD